MSTHETPPKWRKTVSSTMVTDRLGWARFSAIIVGCSSNKLLMAILAKNVARELRNTRTGNTLESSNTPHFALYVRCMPSHRCALEVYRGDGAGSTKACYVS